jgi:hypothetical protein
VIERERSRCKKKREPPQTLTPCRAGLILGATFCGRLRLPVTFPRPPAGPTERNGGTIVMVVRKDDNTTGKVLREKGWKGKKAAPADFCLSTAWPGLSNCVRGD